MIEEWRSVVNYELTHEISSIGRLRRVTTRYGNPQNKILSRHVGSSGYLMADLSDGKTKTYYVHALVAEAFLGRRPDGYHVNHIDGDKLNNDYRNLEYLLCRDNLRHAATLGRGGIKLTADKVRALRGRYLEVGHCATVAREFGIDESHAYRIIARQYWRDVN